MKITIDYEVYDVEVEYNSNCKEWRLYTKESPQAFGYGNSFDKAVEELANHLEQITINEKRIAK